MARKPNAIDELRRLVREAGTQAKAGAQLGVGQSYVCDLLAGRREFSDNMLSKLGLKREVVRQ
jgi:hypothetical protein